MKEGTPIYAARGGTVYSFKDNSNEDGPFAKYERKANYIIIKHNDGSFGCYWHLQKGGVVTKKGKVTKGQLIGYSGNTGFVLRPHLHFAVKRKLNYEMSSFVRTKFRTTKGVELLKDGEFYEKPISQIKTSASSPSTFLLQSNHQVQSFFLLCTMAPWSLFSKKE